MSKKIRKGDVVLAKDLTEDYWGSEANDGPVECVRAEGGGVSCNWDDYNEGN